MALVRYLPCPTRVLIVVCVCFLLLFGPTALHAERRLQQEGDTPSPPTQIRVCIPVSLETSEDIAACNDVIKMANDDQNGVEFSCLPGETLAACISMVNDGVAHMAKLPGSGFLQGLRENLRPIVSEFFGEELGEGVEGYSVAIVDADWCYQVNETTGREITPDLSLLEGMNACFSGYRADAGWKVPMGAMYNTGQMKARSNSNITANDAEAALAYFEDICAPGFQASAPRSKNGKYKTMCQLCEDISDGSCGVNDVVYGNGITKCVGDVIFTNYPLIDPTARPPPFPTPPPAPPPTVPPATRAAAPYLEEDETSSTAPEPSTGNNEQEDKNPSASNSDSAPSPSENLDNPSALDKEADTRSPSNSSSKDSSSNDDNESKNNSDDDERRRLLMRRKIFQTEEVEEDGLIGKLLLCGSRGEPPCKPMTSYKECNLGQVPAAAFASTDSFAKSPEGSLAINALTKAGTDPEFMGEANTIGYPPFSLISKGVINLTAVDLSQKSETYLEATFRRNIEGYESLLLAETGETGNTPSGDGDNKGLGLAAIIGIVVAVVIAVAVILIIVFVLIRKRKERGWQKYRDAIRQASIRV